MNDGTKNSASSMEYTNSLEANSTEQKSKRIASIDIIRGVYRKESQEKTVHPWDLLSQFSDFGLTDNTHFDYYLS